MNPTQVFDQAPWTTVNIAVPARSCGSGQKTTTSTWDSVFTCTRDQVFLSHSRIALLSNASPLARRMFREALAT